MNASVEEVKRYFFLSLFEPNQSVFDSDGDDYSHLTLVTDILSTVISVKFLSTNLEPSKMTSPPPLKKPADRPLGDRARPHREAEDLRACRHDAHHNHVSQHSFPFDLPF